MMNSIWLTDDEIIAKPTNFLTFLTFGATTVTRLDPRITTSLDMAGIGCGNAVVRKTRFAAWALFAVSGP